MPVDDSLLKETASLRHGIRAAYVELIVGSLFRFAERLLVGTALYTIMLLQIINAANAVPESDQEAIATMFEVGPVVAGPWSVASATVALWVSLPLLRALLAPVSGYWRFGRSYFTKTMWRY